MQGVRQRVLIALLLGHILGAGYNLGREAVRTWSDYRRLSGKEVDERKRVMFGPFYDFVRECQRTIPPEAEVWYRGRHTEMLVYHLLPRRAYLDNSPTGGPKEDAWVVEIGDYIGFDPVRARIYSPQIQQVK